MIPGYTVLISRTDHVHPSLGWIPIETGQVIEPSQIAETLKLLRDCGISFDFATATFDSRDSMLVNCTLQHGHLILKGT